MSDFKTYKVCYTMMDGEVFKRTVMRETYNEAVEWVREGLEKTSFILAQRPEVVLVSANVRNVDIVEKL